MKKISIFILCLLGFISMAQDVVTYEKFGAKGDGKTNDFDALIKAHAYANKNNLPVEAKNDATYYLGGDNKTITIQTDTNWGDAKFIIDDTKVENRKRHVFSVTSKMRSKAINNIKSLKKNQTKVDYKAEQGAMILAIDKNVKRFVRKGVNQNNGSPQNDAFIVDKNGNVDPNAAIQWNFDNISSMTMYPIDNNTLTIKGGNITTIANSGKLPNKYDAYRRGLVIWRSNTVLDGVKHYVTNEGDTGYPYEGFFFILKCANVTLKNCLMTARKTFVIRSGPNKQRVAMGSYDLGAFNAHNITLLNCKQTNDINDTTLWGIMGANFTKNITYDGCKLSRFDTHRGVINATIKNSELGYQGIKIIGGGKLLIENCTINSYRLLTFRDDYGSSWEGELIIRNCVFNSTNKKFAPIIFAWNNRNHDFGYKCYMPEKITIENVTVNGSNNVSIFNDPVGNAKDANIEKYPYYAPKIVTIKNLKVADNKYTISPNKEFFKNTKFVIK